MASASATLDSTLLETASTQELYRELLLLIGVDRERVGLL
jgi:hypothetical protein